MAMFGHMDSMGVSIWKPREVHQEPRNNDPAKALKSELARIPFEVESGGGGGGERGRGGRGFCLSNQSQVLQ